MDEDGLASASTNGLLHCLRFLAQEAASLKLVRTLSAIEEALDTAMFESGAEARPGGRRHARAAPLLN